MGRRANAEIATERAAAALLRDALDRITDGDRFTTGAAARRQDGAACHPEDDRAVRWDAVGSLTLSARTAEPEIFDAAYHALFVAAWAAYSLGIISTTEAHGHTAALRIYNAAIKTLEN